VKVETKNLTVQYRDDDHLLLALDRVDLALRPGRITALVGESGSGKTTLAKAMMGLLPDNAETAGAIRIGDREITALDETALNTVRWSQVAMVFQNGAANLNPVYRVVDQVAEPLVQRKGMARATAREQALGQLEEMGLEAALCDRYPHELSGGQVQRVLLAMALVLDPPVLILDEPTAALDAMTKTFIARVLGDLAGRGKTLLLITHDLDLARWLADDIAVLYLGQVQETLPARSLFEPRHPYTLALARSYPGLDAVRDLGGIRGDAFYRLAHAHPRNGHSAGSHRHVVSNGSNHDDSHAPEDGCLFRPRCTQALTDCARGEMPMLAADGHRVRCLRGGIATRLVLEGVRKTYGNVEALKPTDLTLRCGEVFCLVGETGSGKTTLAMLAGGALDPDGGRRHFDGREMTAWSREDVRSLAARIGIIYQHPAEAVSHRFTVFDAVAEPLRIQQKELDRKALYGRVLAALSDVHLSTGPEFLKRYPHELNMGALQRLCLARALVHDPVLLVADEPTSALDPSVQAKILKMLLGLQIEKGLTLLFVTHDIGLARKIGDRIGVMLDGRIVEIGPATRVLQQPGHPYTARLIESARGLGEPFPGGEPSPGEPREGCPFRHRCDRRTPECRTTTVGAADLDSGHHLAWCHHPIAQPADAGAPRGRTRTAGTAATDSLSESRRRL
jgi:peptide/nickel transport system ATP-binding protein